ncbi:MAG: hypothetical protein ACJAZS_000828, partial [Alteromonas naphthalenivorans]
MKHIKQLFYIFFLLNVFYINAAGLSLEQQIEADLFDFDPEMSVIDAGMPTTITRGTTSSTTMILISPTIKAHLLLQNPIYYRTNPIARKNVIDLPIFQQPVMFGPSEKRFGFLPFYSQTFNEHYYKDFNELKDYIDLDQEHIVRILDDRQFTAFNIPQVLKLFGSMKLQEHRIGIMFNWSLIEPDWSLYVRVPLYYDEHNFYLTPSEQDEITKLLGAADPDFAFDHMVADFLALGDTKLSFEYQLKKDHRYELNIGLRVTLPTKIRFGKGLAGAYFDVDKDPKSLDLHTDILNVPATPLTPNNYTTGEINTITNNATNFGLDVLDHLSTLLLEQGSRNYLHVGIGPFMRSTMHFSNKCYLSNIMSLEIATPAQERRFFLIKNDETAFNAFNWNNPSNPQEKIDFLNAQLKEKFFPPGYTVSVFPGI